MLWYPFWGSERTFPHFAAGWAWAMGTPFKWVKQVASHFGGTAQGVVMSWPGHIDDTGGIRRQFHHLIDIVPTILEATGIPGTEDDRRHRAAADRRREHDLHLGQGGRRRPHRRTRPSISRCSATAPSTTTAGSRRRRRPPCRGSSAPPRLPDVITGYKWELYNVAEDPTQSERPRRADAGQGQGDAGRCSTPRRRSTTCCRSTTRPLARWNAPRPNLTGRADRVHLHRRAQRRADQRRAAHPRPRLHHHRRGRDPRGRRRRHDRHRRRPLRRLRALPQQGRVRRRPRQAGLPLQPPRPQAHRLGRPRARARQAHHRLRLQARRPRPRQGRHRRAVGRRQGSRAQHARPHHPDHLPRGRDLRRRPGHPHPARVGRVPLRHAVPLHRHDRQADLRPRTGAASDEPRARRRGGRGNRDRPRACPRPGAGRGSSCWAQTSPASRRPSRASPASP